MGTPCVLGWGWGALGRGRDWGGITERNAKLVLLGAQLFVLIPLSAAACSLSQGSTQTPPPPLLLSWGGRLCGMLPGFLLPPQFFPTPPPLQLQAAPRDYRKHRPAFFRPTLGPSSHPTRPNCHDGLSWSPQKCQTHQCLIVVTRLAELRAGRRVHTRFRILLGPSSPVLLLAPRFPMRRHKLVILAPQFRDTLLPDSVPILIIIKLDYYRTGP